MARAVVVGSINRDVVAFADHQPRPGETVLTARGALYPGGKGSNQAVAIARLGGAVALCGSVGDDTFGREMRAFLAAEGIDTSTVSVLPGGVTGLALIVVDAAGQNAITVVSGANQLWHHGVPDLRLRSGDIVVCQLEIPVPVVTAAFLQARAAGCRTVLNAAPFQPLPAELIAATDILVVNELELAALAGVETSITAKDLARLSRHVSDILAQGPSLVAVTLGSDGVYLEGRDAAAVCIPGRKVKARDTTGAGDCFVGAFVAELLRRREPCDAAAFANAAAALSVTREGAAASLPKRAEVDAFLSG